MRAEQWIAICAVLFTSAGCVSPEEQRAMDQRRCTGFGFATGSEAMANCMMQTAQQREARQAAQAREDARERMISDQMRQEREQARRTADAAAEQRRQSDVMRMMSSPAPGGTGMPSISSAHCTVTSGVNAGTMTCH